MILHGDGAAHRVAVAAEIFGERMNHHVRAEFEGTLKNGSREGVFADQEGAGGSRGFGDGADADDFDQRIRRGFDPE